MGACVPTQHGIPGRSYTRLYLTRIEAALADDLLSLREAAVVSGLSASHLRLLARTGKVQARKLGRDWFTTEAAVLAYVADQALAKEEPAQAPVDPVGHNNR